MIYKVEIVEKLSMYVEIEASSGEDALGRVTKKYWNGEIIVESEYGVGLISGGNGVDELLRMNDLQLTWVMDELMELESIADYIIFDTGAGINDAVERLVFASTDTIVVTTPEPTAVTDAYALIKTIYQSGQWPQFHLLANKAESAREANLTLDNFTRIAGKYMEMDIFRLGYILFDPAMSRAIKAQMPLVASFPRSVAAGNLETVVNALLGTPVKTRGGVREFFDRLVHRRSISAL
jgi:flagellar biosynthesis protein FlhG